MNLDEKIEQLEHRLQLIHFIKKILDCPSDTFFKTTLKKVKVEVRDQVVTFIKTSLQSYINEIESKNSENPFTTSTFSLSDTLQNNSQPTENIQDLKKDSDIKKNLFTNSPGFSDNFSPTDQKENFKIFQGRLTEISYFTDCYDIHSPPPFLDVMVIGKLNDDMYRVCALNDKTKEFLAPIDSIERKRSL